MVKPFEGILGGNCELKIIEFLLPLVDIDFNISELAEEAEVSRPTVTNVVKKFVEWGLMKESHVRGGISYYQIDTESPFIILFEQMNNVIIEKMLGDEILFELHDYWKQQSPKPSTLTTSVEAKPEISKIVSNISEIGISEWCRPNDSKDESPLNYVWPIGQGVEMDVAN